MVVHHLINRVKSISSGLHRAVCFVSRTQVSAATELSRRSMRRGEVWLRASAVCAGLLGLTYVPARAQTVTGGVAAGSLPISIAVNPMTNKIYVANENSNNVTVIDGATNATTTVGAGKAPVALAVNPVTNKIYVANQTGNSVTVIDGATNATQTVSL